MISAEIHREPFNQSFPRVCDCQKRWKGGGGLYDNSGEKGVVVQTIGG